MISTIHEASELIRAAFLSVPTVRDGGVDIRLERPKDSLHGDLATNVALLLSGRLRRSPRNIATEITDSLDILDEVIDNIEIAGPGFINFRFSTRFLQRGLLNLLQEDESYGRLYSGEGKRAQVEFVSANPTGPLTVGHGRQAVTGDVVARILENAGYTVDREYYFNDAGRQMKLLGASIQAQYLKLQDLPFEVPDGGYVGAYVEDLARGFKDEYGTISPTPDIDTFTSYGRDAAFAGIRQTLARIGIEFDQYYSEQSLYDTGRIQKIISALKHEGFAYERDGAVWLDGSQLHLEQDWVMVKSTGEPTYRLPDIAYHIHKIERGYHLIIDVFGADHQDTYPVVLAAVNALGSDTERIRVLIHQFVTLKRGGRDVKMSKRKGEFYTLDDLISEVGSDAVRFFYLLRILNSHLSFDIDLALKQSDENPVFYVQYAHARTAGILRHANAGEMIQEGADTAIRLLETTEELNLIRQLLLFPVVMQQVTESLEPQRITEYVRDVATVFHRFYQHHRIITEDAELSMARLALVRGVRIVLRRCMGILGVHAPDRM